MVSIHLRLLWPLKAGPLIFYSCNLFILFCSGCNVMTADRVGQMTERSQPFLGQRSRKVGQLLGDTL